jgi:hypothetical protein
VKSTMQLAKPITWAAVLLAPIVLTDCSSDRANPFAGPRAAQTEPPKPAAPPVAMDGRWLLSSTGSGMCGMNFTSAPEGTSGKIAPEGGCPGRFFTSRQWRFEQGGLLILDHKEQPLAQLASTEPPGSFQGRANSGISVSLSRGAPPS